MELYITESPQDCLNNILKGKKYIQSPMICDGKSATKSMLYNANIILNLDLFIQRHLHSDMLVNVLPHKLLKILMLQLFIRIVTAIYL
ncbi:hypothetical protein [Cellulosilyticum ruminicola]|uniref:hypothetical protein n=1 Tax=Cellulosilyticum ruminicola TaxID=425254 RepID=UPI0006CF7DAE|nr:hypothetical protein [Cellulosilyticum ruminicola]